MCISLIISSIGAGIIQIVIIYNLFYIFRNKIKNNYKFVIV